MARIARDAGISKALLYHYFPSKREYFAETLREAADDVARHTEPDPSLPPLEALTGSVDAYLAWIEENRLAYSKLIEGATGVSEVRDIMAEVRERTAARILDGLGFGEDPPRRPRAAVRGWLWFIDGACLDWLEHHDMERREMRDLLLGTLVGALTAAGGAPPAAAGGGSGGSAGGRG